jgi:hypothetical protein
MNTQRGHFEPKRVALAALAGGSAAATANIAWFLLMRGLGADFMIQPDAAAPAMLVGIPNVVVASFVPALLAGGLLLLLDRFTSNAGRVYVIIASVAALLSLAGPITIGGASAGTRMALAVMHVLTATAISGALVRIGSAGRTAQFGSAGRE